MFNILFLNLLMRTDYPLNELTKFTGTTFLLQKVFAESIIQREMEMFGEIQMENHEFHKILDEFEILIKQYKEIIQPSVFGVVVSCIFFFLLKLISSMKNDNA